MPRRMMWLPMMQEPTALTTDDEILAVLERARTVGFLGPGPLRVHLDHARAYGTQLPPDTRRLIDLGSGGGLPGVPLLADRPEVEGVLLDAAAKRTAFLVWATVELGLGDRVEVITDRAEVAAHRSDLRATFDAVVCRGFGPPAITIECACGYLRLGGRLLISEPPERREWDTNGLATVGLAHVGTVDGVAAFERVGDVPASTPRSQKRMTRTPLAVER